LFVPPNVVIGKKLKLQVSFDDLSRKETKTYKLKNKRKGKEGNNKSVVLVFGSAKINNTSG